MKSLVKKGTKMDTKRFEAPVLEPTTQRFIDALSSQGGKPVYQLSIAEAREVLEGLQRQPVEKLPSQEEDITIPGGPSGKISTRIIRPPNSTGKLPVVMYIHGGGWIFRHENIWDVRSHQGGERTFRLCGGACGVCSQRGIESGQVKSLPPADCQRIYILKGEQPCNRE